MKAMFQPGPPLLFREKISKRRPTPYTGVAAYRDLFETTAPPEPEKNETPRERRKKPPDAVAPLTTGDAYKTLFVARLSYDTTEKKLRREFEQFGAIKALRVVHERDPDHEPMEGDDDALHAGTPRGYAFVEFERESDMRDAYKR
ncbi:snRNA binding protein [Aureococcus anophagefferens]|nr:snRNA binding protein [Aureococcus anophagefferens]